MGKGTRGNQETGPELVTGLGGEKKKKTKSSERGLGEFSVNRPEGSRNENKEKTKPGEKKKTQR